MTRILEMEKVRKSLGRTAVRRVALGAAVLLSLAAPVLIAQAERRVEFALGKSVEIGRQELMFGSVASVCEDGAGNFFILDGKEFRVYKYAPDGRQLLAFGRKGQGPGDLQSPHMIVLTPAGELAVLENFFISFFKTDGAFIRRLELFGRFELVYAGPDRFLGWIWKPEGRAQVLLDGRNNVVAEFHTQPRESFSTSLADETGRGVMFNYSSDVYVPELLYACGEGMTLTGISPVYDLSMLDGNGRVCGSIRRDLKPTRISGRERAFLEQEIREFARARNWPAAVSRELARKIPEFKAFIRAVRISPRHIFVFRVPDDISSGDGSAPVDVFSRDGGFLGSTAISKIPLFVSDKAAYFVETDDSGLEYLRRTEYSLKSDVPAR